MILHSACLAWTLVHMVATPSVCCPTPPSALEQSAKTGEMPPTVWRPKRKSSTTSARNSASAVLAKPKNRQVARMHETVSRLEALHTQRPQSSAVRKSRMITRGTDHNAPIASARNSGQSPQHANWHPGQKTIFSKRVFQVKSCRG